MGKHVVFMNNLLSYCGLIDAKIRASDKDLPVNTSEKFQPLPVASRMRAMKVTTAKEATQPMI